MNLTFVQFALYCSRKRTGCW